MAATEPVVAFKGKVGLRAESFGVAMWQLLKLVKMIIMVHVGSGYVPMTA